MALNNKGAVWTGLGGKDVNEKLHTFREWSLFMGPVKLTPDHKRTQKTYSASGLDDQGPIIYTAYLKHIIFMIKSVKELY